MIPVIINSILFLGLVLYVYNRQKTLSPGLFVAIIYWISSVISIFEYSENDYWHGHLSYWSFSYLFIIFLLFFRTELKSELKVDFSQLNYNFLITVLVYIYILSGLYLAVVLSARSVDIFSGGDFLAQRTMLYYDEDFQLYKNIVERIAMNIISYFKIFAIMMFFYFLSIKKYKLSLLLLASILIPLFQIAILTAARGSIYTLVIIFITMYFCFKKYISAKLNRVFLTGSLVILALFGFFVVSVSVSRFGDAFWDSLRYYFGHGMLTFNYGLTDTLNQFAYGEYAFKWFYADSLLDIDSLGAHMGTSFVTFVGNLYIDFGPFFTIIMALIIPSLVMRLIKKQDFASLFFHFFYLDFLLAGVFVHGSGYALDWIMAFIIYSILKIRLSVKLKT